MSEHGGYPTGSGDSGTPASRARAVEMDKRGATGELRERVLAALREAGSWGLTDAEVQQRIRRGHGSTSAALTRLHREGAATRLKERRGRGEVYVLTEHAGERPTSPYRPRPDCAGLAQELAENEQTLLLLRQHLASTNKAITAAYSLLIPHGSIPAVGTAMDLLTEEGE